MVKGTSAAVRPIVIHRKQFGFRVRYLRVSAQYGEGPLVQFLNRTEHTAEIEFFDDLVRFDGGGPVKTLVVERGGRSELLTVNEELRGVFEYRVFLKEAGVEAEGGSRPEIEIEP